MKKLFSILAILLIGLIIGCGGGPDAEDKAAAAAEAGTSTTITTTTTQGSITLTLSSYVVSFGTPASVTATIRDAGGAVVQGAVVTFAATSGLVTFTPTSATALTNASGVATINLNATSIDSAGATGITASATFTSGVTTVTLNSTPVGIAVNGAALTLGDITLGLSPISSYGTSSVSVPVFVNGLAATVPISVKFTSPCVTAGKATLSSPVTTIAGTAISTYKDNGCGSATDTITASVTGDSKQATITVTIPGPNNIEFVSATPSIIGTSTASAPTLVKQSVVKFRVVDSNNNGKSGVLVNFTIVPASAPGGITLSVTQATSDANGYVTTALTSGTVPTPVWVKATIDGTTLTSQSNTLTITTGLPTQDFFSLSVQTYNIEGWNYDGETSTLTIIASDRLGNPVPDGTAINFITEGAQITPAFCSTISGTCSVKFTSAESRPTDGRVSILAYAIGEKSFVDANNNNSYDYGETFYDIGDPYIDNNENRIWDAGEFSIASTTSGSSECLTQSGGGALPSNYALSKGNTCTTTWESNYVRRNAIIVLSGSYASTPAGNINMDSSCTGYLTFMLYDQNNNPMPAGTTVTIENNNVFYSYSNGAVIVAATADISVVGTPVLNTTALGGTSVSLTVSAGPACALGTIISYPVGFFNVVVTTPNGNITTIPITVTGNTAP
jgi:hypothetical protein